uniref:MDM2 proto-oncogene n=1 Tax=Strix occidentalis caurina TaxID=311401 RepID=A0A8D0F0I7_STROC
MCNTKMSSLTDASSVAASEPEALESVQELDEKQTSNVTSRPTTSSRRRTHSESGLLEVSRMR